MASEGKFVCLFRWILISLVNIQTFSMSSGQATVPEKTLDQSDSNAKDHTYNGDELLVFMGLLIATIVSIWVIKHFRLRFIHETGLSIVYGIVIGAVVTYGSQGDASTAKQVDKTVNETDPRIHNQSLILNLVGEDGELFQNYTCEKAPTNSVLGSKMVFDPEIFFYVLLPPIIFHAGYSMKRRHFFRNFGAIITFAFIGTLISTFTIGGILYGFVQGLRPAVTNMTSTIYPDFTFQQCVWYGSIISATDPVTVLAIFHDLNVDVDLYALVFGESVLNDAVAITLAKSIEKSDGNTSVASVFITIGMFFGIFIGSFSIGLAIGCINALLTKFTKIRDFPLLESSLLMLMSYTSYLVAEALHMSGIVSVLFCGIFQAHYTFNNLSDESKKSTKQVIEMLNFIAENFVFLYIGVTVFTRKFHAREWNPWFIFGSFIAMVISRAVNIYPLSFLLNLGRKNKISYNFQHMMMFSGLRGAIAFALAINEASKGIAQVNTFLTTTIILVVLTVIGCGALTLSMLQWLKIRVGVDDPTETQAIASTPQADGADGSPESRMSAVSVTRAERAEVVKIWNKLDNAVFKPILTNYRVTLSENFPHNRFCGVLSRFCTTPQQFENCARHTTGDDNYYTLLDDNDSDIDMIIDADELTLNNPANGNSQPRRFGTADSDSGTTD